MKFQSTRGLRQSEPISAHLFVMVVEVFSWMMERVVNEGYIRGEEEVKYTRRHTYYLLMLP